MLNKIIDIVYIMFGHVVGYVLECPYPHPYPFKFAGNYPSPGPYPQCGYLPIYPRYFCGCPLKSRPIQIWNNNNSLSMFDEFLLTFFFEGEFLLTWLFAFLFFFILFWNNNNNNLSMFDEFLLTCLFAFLFFLSCFEIIIIICPCLMNFFWHVCLLSYFIFGKC